MFSAVDKFKSNNPTNPFRRWVSRDRVPQGINRGRVEWEGIILGVGDETG